MQQRDRSEGYFSTQADCERMLIAEGYERNPDSARYGWSDKSGIVSASVRWNAEGFFILYYA